jgi:hypothetical protein
MNTKLIACLLFLCPLIGCAIDPASFVRASAPSWSSVELRTEIGPEDAWREVVDVLARNFELELISKDGGYLRTSWIYTWWKDGKVTENYRVRAIIKFPPSGTKVDIKTEAEFLHRRVWVRGTDTRLLQTVKTDIMGVVGRTTR